MYDYIHNPAPANQSTVRVRYETARLYKSPESLSVSHFSSQEAISQALSEIYQFKNYSEVKGFLKKHGYLADTLLPALAKVRTYFGENTQVALEVVKDIEEGECLLFAFVRTPLPVSEVLARRRQFDEEWWWEASEQARGQLIFDVEFI